MPTAVPTCLAVLLIPDAAPLRRGSTTPIAAVASGGFTKPIPMPARMKPGRSVVQSSLGLTPCISTRPRPISAKAGGQEQRGPDSAPTSFPAMGAARKDRSDTGRKRSPLSSGV